LNAQYAIHAVFNNTIRRQSLKIFNSTWNQSICILQLQVRNLLPDIRSEIEITLDTIDMLEICSVETRELIPSPRTEFEDFSVGRGRELGNGGFFSLEAEEMLACRLSEGF